MQQERMFRKLGDYLVGIGACEESLIDQFISRQHELRVKGYDAFFGRLLLDSGVITGKDLTLALKQQDIDRLATSTLFRSLPLAIIQFIQEQAVQRFFHAGDVIFRQDDESDHMYILMQGAVSQSHRPASGTETDVSILRFGDFFGEMSLLAGCRRFTTARAIEPTRVLGVPREVFLELYRTIPQLPEAAAQRWFKIIVDGRVESQSYQDKHYQDLLAHKQTHPCAQILGNSRRAVELRRQIDRLAALAKPILILGEPGTMKKRVAQALFAASPEKDDPYIVFDPLDIPSFIITHPEDDQTFASFAVEMRQLAALFGLSNSRSPLLAFVCKGMEAWLS